MDNPPHNIGNYDDYMSPYTSAPDNCNNENSNNNPNSANSGNIGNNSDSRTNNNGNINNSGERSTFNLRKAVELRQVRLQQRKQQQQHQPYQSAQNDAVTDNVVANATHSPTRRLAHNTRRKRLQRQTPTELDDMDFAYAADLEEEAEEDPHITHDTDSDNNITSNATLTSGEKRLPHFSSMRNNDTTFTGQPSSLPSCYTTTTTTTTAYHLQQHQQHQHYQHHKSYQQTRQHAYHLKHAESFDSSTTTTTNTTDTANSPNSPSLRRHNFAMLKRDNSTQSESSSRYSSVDSLLEARKPDPEAILINLGFGPIGSEDILSRIPKRFLKPSQVRGIDTEAFIRRLQLASNLADHSVLGYRGLTGNPDVPPSRIVAKIMQRFEVNERKKSMGSIEHTM